MTVTGLERRFDYNYWANRKLLAAVATLSPEEFTRSVAGSYGSIRNTLVHTMSAEWGWIARCGGPARGPMLKGDDYPTLESIVEQWGIVEGYAREFLGTLSDGDLDRAVEFDLGPVGKGAVPVGQLLEHAANHGAHHRGQVALLMRVLGHAPGNFDVLFYDLEKHAAAV
jgi:uncharacterized damage-inducible protein DinB